MATTTHEHPASRGQHPRPAGTMPPPAPRALTIGTLNFGTLTAELVGTFLFVWMGTGTLLATKQLAPAAHLNDVAISLAFGLGLMVAVFAVGPISGAHLNPAVTFSLALFREFPWRNVPGYMVAQFVGATCAGLANWYMFGGGVARSRLLLGATQPGPRGWGVALFTEFLLTAILLVTIAVTAIDRRSPGQTAAGLAIGLVVGAGIFATLPVSGGSFNPARTLGPMIAAQNFTYWWVYFAGPVAGAVVGVGLYELVLKHGRTPGEGRVPETEAG